MITEPRPDRGTEISTAPCWFETKRKGGGVNVLLLCGVKDFNSPSIFSFISHYVLRNLAESQVPLWRVSLETESALPG